MPELRLDPLTGLRAIIAGERASRPGAFSERVEPRPPIDAETGTSVGDQLADDDAPSPELVLHNTEIEAWIKQWLNWLAGCTWTDH